MTKNPFLNALLAAVYIILILLTMQGLTSIKAIQSTILIPLAVLGLFVLSTAVMGFLFVYEPFQLYFAGLKKEALLFFAKTLSTFAIIVFAFICVLLLLK